MTTIYAVERWTSYEGSYVVALYSTKNLAEAIVDNLTKQEGGERPYSGYQVTTYTLDKDVLA